jgi:hypothetical protein
MKARAQLAVWFLVLIAALTTPGLAKFEGRDDGPSSTQPSRGAQLSCKDAASGITVTVQDDGITLVATGADNKVLWSAKETEKVRDVSIAGKAVRSIHGKHSYTDRDLATGKVTGAGSD